VYRDLKGLGRCFKWGGREAGRRGGGTEERKERKNLPGIFRHRTSNGGKLPYRMLGKPAILFLL